MFHKQFNNEFGTKKVTSARQVSASKSQRKRDDHRNERKLRSMSGHHYSQRKSMRRTHAISGPGIIANASPVRRKRIRPKTDIMQGELRKIKAPTLYAENRKGEEAKAWLLEMKKYSQFND